MSKEKIIYAMENVSLQHDDNASVELVWQNLSIKTEEDKLLLKNVNGKILPGEMVALMGSSGAGKTTLLNSLTGRLPRELSVLGNILVNGKERNPNTWGKASAYVSQVFHAYENQTVEETLRFIYSMKDEKDNINAKIDQMIGRLGLSHSKNTFVGRLSGGEKVRLSVGIELIGNPSIIFLDEPLSGLDSFNAQNVVVFLKELAAMGKTIIVTIHQPSYKMIRYFDRIYLMARGGVIFDGSCDDCIEYFKERGYNLPVNTNPVEFFLDTIAVDYSAPDKAVESLKRIEFLKREWTDHCGIYYPKLYNSLLTQKRPHASTLTMFWKLYTRNISNYLRNRRQLAIRILFRLFIGIVFSITFWQLGNRESVSILSFRGVFTFLVLNQISGVAGPIYNLFKQEFNVLLRERRSGLYTAAVSYIARYFSQATVVLMIEMPYILAVYFMTGFYSNVLKFIHFFLIMTLQMLYAISLGLSISIIAPTANSAHTLGASLSILFVLYSGAFCNPNDLPPYLAWFMYCSPVHYAFKATMQSQSIGMTFTFKSDDVTKCDSNDLLDAFGMHGMGIYKCLGVLCCYIVGFILMGMWSLYSQTKSRLKINK